MNTTDLITTCLKYPLLMDVLAFDNMKDGFEITLNKFNGYQELKNRTDVGDAFIKVISAINVKDVESCKDLPAKGKFAINLSIYELMVTDSAVLSKLSSVQQLLLLKDIRDKLKAKDKEIFGTLGKYTSAYALSRVLEKMGKLNKSDSDMMQFTNKRLLKNANTLDDIILIADSTLLSNKN
jgi:hypothetical protein